MTPMPAAAVLDSYFLEARARLLDLGAILDRIDRGGSVADERLAQIRRALELLSAESPGRAAAVQELFSLPYDSSWIKPVPR